MTIFCLVIQQDQLDELSKLLSPNQSLPVLPLQVVLDNNTALSYFIGACNKCYSCGQNLKIKT